MTPRSLTAILLLLAAPASADDRPAVGARVPLPVLRDLAGTERPLTQLAGPRGIALLFWAPWSDRSVDQLKQFDALAPEMARQGVGVVAISVDGHMASESDLASTRGLVKRLGVRLPVLVDRGLKLFDAYGVVTVPSTALVDGKGTLAYFAYGYALERRADLLDALDRLAGITRRHATGVPVAAPAAIRRLQLGRVQLSHGHVGPARESFETAVEADPAFVDPIVELAALALDEHDLAGAREAFERAASLDPAHHALRRERARLLLIEQRAADATAVLTELAAGGTDPVAAAYLGYLLHAAGDTTGAQLAFDRVKSGLGVDPRTFLRADTAHGRGTGAMVAFRREVAAGRR